MTDLEAVTREARSQVKAAADIVPPEKVQEALSMARAAILRSDRAVAASAELNVTVDQLISGLSKSIFSTVFDSEFPRMKPNRQHVQELRGLTQAGRFCATWTQLNIPDGDE